ncbi:hypothetical protein KDA_18920 [Dictyobacter alpinus]|uniref:Uncharacterized protein n=1 Tax=Dictyobacter alpinus TaxID=2014873 RepID=A0A402B4Y6_9CHLR|nr:hypothetical protein [Dictyobacter alpinus]GCE26408.1 hypothetical protein KDA_18920 [Dictyobacter alpinus]
MHTVVLVERQTADEYAAHDEHKWWKTNGQDSGASHESLASTRDNGAYGTSLARHTTPATRTDQQPPEQTASPTRRSPDPSSRPPPQLTSPEQKAKEPDGKDQAMERTQINRIIFMWWVTEET